MKKLLFLLVPVMFVATLTVVPSAVAQESVDLFKNVCSDKNTADQSAVCQDKTTIAKDAATKPQNPIYGPNGILTTLINILSLIAGIVAVVIIILAGLRFITSGSNPQDVSNARERVIYAAVGLIVVGLAQVFVRFILGKTGVL